MVLAWPLELAAAPEAPPSNESEGDRPMKVHRTSLSSSASASSRPQLPPLTGVAVVCREFPKLWALLHVVDLISDFADGTQNWFLEDAVPSMRLLKRLHARERMDPLINDQFFRDWQFNRAANAAAAYGNLEVLKWLVSEYSPGNVMTEAVQQAAANGQLEVVKWLYEEYPFVVVGLEELGLAAQNAHVEVVKYLVANPPSAEYRQPRMSDQAWAREMRRRILEDDMFEISTLEYLQWAVGNGYVGEGFGLCNASRSCRLDVVQWLAGHLDQVFKSGGGIRVVGNNEEEVERHTLFHEGDFDTDEDDDDDDEDWIPGRNNEPDGEEEMNEGDEEEEESTEVDRGSNAFHFPQSVDINDLAGPEGFKVAKWLHEQNFTWLNLSAASEAMEINADCADYVKWLCRHNYGELTGRVIDCAAIQGDLDLLKFLHEKSSSRCTTNAMDGAAAHGDLEIVMWLHENRTEGCTDDAVRRATLRGHFETVKWLLQNRPELNPKTAMASLVEYQIEITSNDPNMPSISAEMVLDMVTWLNEHYRQEHVRKLSADNVASRGHLCVLEVLLKNHIVGCSRSTMDAAAANNRLDVVKWLHKNRTEGCTTKAMDSAARNGHLEMVIWLHQNREEGCTTQAMDHAIVNGHLDVVQWLYLNRTEGASDHQIDEAVQNGFFEMVRWLIEHCGHEQFAKCTPAAMDIAASQGDLRMVRYLHTHCSEGCTTEAMDSAAENGQFEVLLFLHANRSEGCTAKAVELAFHFEHLEILRWLAFHYPHLYNREELLGGMWRNVKALVVNWVRHSGLLVKGSC